MYSYLLPTIDSLSLITAEGIASANQTNVNNDTNWWLVIAIIELVLIILLLITRIKLTPTKEQIVKEEILKEKIDFGNIVRSSFGATELYDKLKKHIHPDRFPNDPQRIAIATELMQLAGKNKTNLKVLEEIKQRAISELNINL